MYEQPESMQGAIAKIGNITVEIYRSSYRLRWRYLGLRYTLTQRGGITPEGLAGARKKATQINADIANNCFDPTLTKYDPSRQRLRVLENNNREQSEPDQYSLRKVWELYKSSQVDRIALTSQKNNWKTTDNALDKVSSQALSLKTPYLIVPELKQHYSLSTIQRVGENLFAAVNWAVRQKIIPEVPPYEFSYKRPRSDRSKRTFTNTEINRIIKAFATDEFLEPDSRYRHSYYQYFLMAIAYTGRRPEDIIALTWDDLIEHEGRRILKISKAHSRGVLKGTKNDLITLYPMNQQLIDVFKAQPRIDNPCNLIFPSQWGTYIDWKNFRNRYWHLVVRALVEKGEIREYLPPYNLRHSRATQFLRSGIDLESVATVLETSIRMLSKHYLEGDVGINLPEL